MSLESWISHLIAAGIGGAIALSLVWVARISERQAAGEQQFRNQYDPEA